MSPFRPQTQQANDWTVGPTGRSNDSEIYRAICRHVESLIRGDAHRLIAGRADDTAALIVSNLAIVWGMRPDRGIK